MSSLAASSRPSPTSRLLGSFPALASRSPQEIEADDICRLQLSALREAVKEMKGDIVRELELVLQRELRSNFEKIEVAVRDMHSLKATEIDMGISRNCQQADSSHIAKLNTSFGKRLAIDGGCIGLLPTSSREVDKRLDDHFLSYVQRLEDLGMNEVQQEGTIGVSEPGKSREICDEIPDSESLFNPQESIFGGQDKILKTFSRGRKEDLELCLEKKLDPNSILYDVQLDLHSKTYSHCSLLALAVLVGRRSLVNLLVSEKASVESTYGFLAGTQRKDWSGPALSATVAKNDIPMSRRLPDLVDVASSVVYNLWLAHHFHEYLYRGNE